MTEPGPAIEAELRDHIAAAFAGRGGLVTKWIVLAEAIGTTPDDPADHSTDTELWTFTSDGLKAWDTAGMLHHAMDLQTAQTLGFATGLLNDDGTGPFL